MFALLECVCEPTLSHQTVSIKPLKKCGPYMPMAVLISGTVQEPVHRPGIQTTQPTKIAIFPNIK